MKRLALAFMLNALCSFSAFAENVSEEKTIDQMLDSLKIEKMQAELLIETMARRGKLNKDEATKAKREVASVKENDEKVFKAEAIERLSSKKSYATK